MPSLREVVDFTQVAGPAGQFPGNRRMVSLRSCGDLVSAVVPADQRSSLRGLGAALPSLPPIALSARITQHSEVVGPSRPIIEVDPPSGAVVETVVNFFSGGTAQKPTASSAIQLIDGDRIDGILYADAVFTEPKAYEAVVSRVGITGSGVVRLEQRLPFRVLAVPPAPPPPAPGPTPGPGPSTGPTCDVEIDGSDPGSGGTANVRVFGGGFAAGDGLVVLENGQPATSTSANGLGGYTVTVGVLRSTVPVSHVFQTVSTSTGATSNPADFRV